jgi:hypothetical protein
MVPKSKAAAGAGSAAALYALLSRTFVEECRDCEEASRRQLMKGLVRQRDPAGFLSLIVSTAWHEPPADAGCAFRAMAPALGFSRLD